MGINFIVAVYCLNVPEVHGIQSAFSNASHCHHWCGVHVHGGGVLYKAQGSVHPHISVDFNGSSHHCMGDG